MKQLLEDYQRRLKTANELIENLKFKDEANPEYVRLGIKASCYRTFIAELERELNNAPTEGDVLRTIFDCVDIRGIDLEDYKEKFANKNSGLYRALIRLFYKVY